MVFAPAFLTSGALLPSSFVGGAATAPAVSARPQRPAVCAKLADWGEGLLPKVPTEEELRSQESVALYAGPREDLAGRSFATLLPVTWAGDVPTFGTTDLKGPFTEAGKLEARLVPEDPESTAAFSAYAKDVKEYRRDLLDAVKEPEASPDGMFMSNYRKELVFGVKCVEYWG